MSGPPMTTGPSVLPSGQPVPGGRRAFSRRAFLGGAASLTLVAVAVRLDPSGAGAAEQALTDGRFQLDSVGVEPAQPVLPLVAERASDLLLVDFTFYGFTVDKTSHPVSLKATATQTADNWIGVVVTLPPQAVGEAEYFYPPVNPNIAYDPTPVLSQVSGPTRLAFTFTTGDSIPLPTMTVEDLLDWSGWDLNVPVTAQAGSGAPLPVEPTTIQTAIECPLALYLAPVVDPAVDGPDVTNKSINGFSTYFANRTAPFVSSEQVTECWTTSLTSYVTGVHLGGDPQLVPTVAAVWADDYLTGNATPQEFIVYGEYEAPPP